MKFHNQVEILQVYWKHTTRFNMLILWYAPHQHQKAYEFIISFLPAKQECFLSNEHLIVIHHHNIFRLVTLTKELSRFLVKLKTSLAPDHSFQSTTWWHSTIPLPKICLKKHRNKSLRCGHYCYHYQKYLTQGPYHSREVHEPFLCFFCSLQPVYITNHSVVTLQPGNESSITLRLQTVTKGHRGKSEKVC